MPRITNGTGALYRTRGLSFAVGETKDVGDDVADRLTDREGFERAAADSDTDDEADGLTELDGVSEDIAEDMRALGIGSVVEVRNADIDTLTDITGIGEKAAEILTDDDQPSIDAALDGTIDGLEGDLASGEYDDRLDDIEAAERDGQDRQGALDAIAARRDELGGE